MHFLKDNIATLIVFVSLAFTDNVALSNDDIENLLDNLDDVPVLDLIDENNSKEELTGRKVIEDNVPSMMAPTPPDINKVGKNEVKRDFNSSSGNDDIDFIDALDDIVSDTPVVIDKGVSNVKKKSEGEKLLEELVNKNKSEKAVEEEEPVEDKAVEEILDEEIEKPEDLPKEPSELKEEVTEDVSAENSVIENNIDENSVIKEDELLAEEAKETKKNEKEAKYKELFKHLSNFLRGHNSDKQVAVKDEDAKTLESNSENNKSDEEGGKSDSIDSLLDIVSPIEEIKPIEEEAPLTPEQIVLKEIKAKFPGITDEMVNKYAGTCLLLPDKVSGCTPYNCNMPSIHWGEEGDIAKISILGMVEDNQCILEYQINNEALPYKYIACSLSVTSKNVISQVIRDYYMSGGQSIRNQDELTPLVTTYKKILNEDECLIKLDDGRAMSFAEFKKQEREEQKKVADENEDKQKRKRGLSKADKAYFDMLTAKRNTLPKNKQFSNDVLETIQDIAENLAPAEVVKEDETFKISVEHSGSPANPAVKDGDGLTVNSSAIDLKIVHESKNEGQVDVKEMLDMAYNALLSGQTSAAISMYKTILDQDYDNESALFGLATTYHKNKQPRQARAIYTEILKINPEHGEALNNYLVLLAEESPENALIELNKLERINPEFSPIPAQIAMIHLKMGNTSKAERYLRRAISLSPNNVVYRYNLAITSDRLGKVGQAVRLYKDVLEEAKGGAIIPGSIGQIEERLAFLKSKL